MTAFKISKQAIFFASLGLISWQLVTSAPGIEVAKSDKIIHIAAFMWLGISAQLAFYKRYQPWISLALLLCAYGLASETVQYFVPGRAFSWLDWLADCAGVGLAYLSLDLYPKRWYALN